MKFAERMESLPSSFIREILKVTTRPEVISFAGGLPKPDLFPIEGIKESCNRVLDEEAESALQYSTTEGYEKLREYIADSYKKQGIEVSADEILITSGSQQALDLIGKVFIDKKDKVIFEKPGYLGAIQAFSLYQPEFLTINLKEDGLDIDQFKKTILENKVKLIYLVPDFQNPSGISYSEEKRKMIARIAEVENIPLVEDNPYGALRFSGEKKSSLKIYNENTISLGTFSKTFVPSFRLGWICAKKELIQKFVTAKQASDLHTNFFAQKVVYDFVSNNDFEGHVEKIRKEYGKQQKAMLSAIKEFFPKEVKYTLPEGGMFLWVTLPEGISAMKLFDKAIEKNVAFVPGTPFYANEIEENTLRLNFSNTSCQNIYEGIKRLGAVIKDFVK